MLKLFFLLNMQESPSGRGHQSPKLAARAHRGFESLPPVPNIKILFDFYKKICYNIYTR